MNTCWTTWYISHVCKFYNLIKLGCSSKSDRSDLSEPISARWGRCFTMTFSSESFSTCSIGGVGKGYAGWTGCSSISFISWTNSLNPSRNSFWLTALTLFSRIEENDLGIHIHHMETGKHNYHAQSYHPPTMSRCDERFLDYRCLDHWNWRGFQFRTAEVL